jgi:hypothetical protein
LPFIALVLILAVATVGAVVVSDGNPAAALLPAAAILLLCLLARLPLRYPALALLFLGMVLESPGEVLASGRYKSPLYLVGMLFLGHINLVVPFKPLIFSGFDFVLIWIFSLTLYRRATRSRIDAAGFVETASPMRYFGWLTVGGAVLLELWGIVRGGYDFDNSLWQFEHAAYLPVCFFAFHYAFRGPQDQRAIGRVIIAAATLRAALAWWLRHFFTPNDIETMPTATTHSDSLLFAGAFCLCITLVLEIPTRKNKVLCLVVLPILTLGMISNNRRLVWVEIAMALVVLFLVMPMTPLKRGLVRWLLMAAPFIAIYLYIGWDRTGRLFAGASMLRSLVDSKTDLSTLWRDFENVDLIATLKSSPLFGLGFGHKYVGPIDVEDVYPQEHFVPHNTVLGLWAFGGLVGFSLNWMFLSMGAFFACRTYRRARRPIDRVVALSAVQMLMIYVNQCYGDLGLGTATGLLLVAAGLSAVGKLALTTGAWPSKVTPAAESRAPMPVGRSATS